MGRGNGEGGGAQSGQNNNKADMKRIRKTEYGRNTNDLEIIAERGRKRAEGVGNERSLPKSDKERGKGKGRFMEDEALKKAMK